MRLYHLTLVPILATTALFAVACKEEGASTSKSTIYTYEMSATNKSGKKVGGRYEYGSRASSYGSKSGKFKTTAKTAGPKHAQISVAIPAGTGPVSCELIITLSGKRIAKVTDSGKNDALCAFKP